MATRKKAEAVELDDILSEEKPAPKAPAKPETMLIKAVGGNISGSATHPRIFRGQIGERPYGIAQALITADIARELTDAEKDQYLAGR